MVWQDILNGLQGILDFFANIGRQVINLLPASPFHIIDNNVIDVKWLQWFNWFFPVGEIVAELQLWVSAIVVFYIYQLILRWVKAIQ